jgi:hypothetical protein
VPASSSSAALRRLAQHAETWRRRPLGRPGRGRAESIPGGRSLACTSTPTPTAGFARPPARARGPPLSANSRVLGLLAQQHPQVALHELPHPVAERLRALPRGHAVHDPLGAHRRQAAGQAQAVGRILGEERAVGRHHAGEVEAGPQARPVAELQQRGLDPRGRVDRVLRVPRRRRLLDQLQQIAEPLDAGLQLHRLALRRRTSLPWLGDHAAPGPAATAALVLDDRHRGRRGLLGAGRSGEQQGQAATIFAGSRRDIGAASVDDRARRCRGPPSLATVTARLAALGPLPGPSTQAAHGDSLRRGVRRHAGQRLRGHGHRRPAAAVADRRAARRRPTWRSPRGCGRRGRGRRAPAGGTGRAALGPAAARGGGCGPGSRGPCGGCRSSRCSGAAGPADAASACSSRAWSRVAITR